MRGNRALWSTALLALIAMLVLNVLAGQASSPVERLLGIHRVPVWWPYVLAIGFGLAFGAIMNRGRGSQTPKAAQGADRQRGNGAGRGRHHVPRHVRRERERQARRQQRMSSATPPTPAPAPLASAAATPRRRWPWDRRA